MPRAKKQTNGSTTQPQVIYSQPNNNVLYVMMGIITIFLIFMTVKVMNLEKQLNAGGTAAPAAAAASPLEVPKLKQYAKDLGLDVNKFNSCLDSGSKQAEINKSIAYGTSLGVQGTPGFFINGRFLAGAFPYNFFKEIIDKEIAGTGSTVCTDYPTDLQQYCSDPKNLAFDPSVKTVDLTGAPSTGVKNGKVTIVEFSDFQCPFCIRAYPTVVQILKDYGNDVTLYYKQFPLTQIHPFAEKAAEASMCAQDQGKFWQFYNKVFTLEQSTNGQ